MRPNNFDHLMRAKAGLAGNPQFKQSAAGLTARNRLKPGKTHV
jgi:hypothetical protein